MNIEKFDPSMDAGFFEHSDASWRGGLLVIPPSAIKALLGLLDRCQQATGKRPDVGGLVEWSVDEPVRRGEACNRAVLAERDSVRTVLRSLGHGSEAMRPDSGVGYEAHGGCPACCDEDECSLCAIVDCLHAEPLHYHHDGCPACETEDK